MCKENLKELQKQKRETTVRGALVADIQESMSLEH